MREEPLKIKRKREQDRDLIPLKEKEWKGWWNADLLLVAVSADPLHADEVMKIIKNNLSLKCLNFSQNYHTEILGLSESSQSHRDFLNKWKRRQHSSNERISNSLKKNRMKTHLWMMPWGRVLIRKWNSQPTSSQKSLLPQISHSISSLHKLEAVSTLLQK